MIQTIVKKSKRKKRIRKTIIKKIKKEKSYPKRKKKMIKKKTLQKKKKKTIQKIRKIQRMIIIIKTINNLKELNLNQVKRISEKIKKQNRQNGTNPNINHY